MWEHAWSWLLVHEPQYLFGAGTGAAVTRVLGWRPRAHARLQRQIADRLDTATPGGLAELTGRLEEMAKIISTGVATGATTAGAAVANSVDTHPSDHPKPSSGGGGTK